MSELIREAEFEEIHFKTGDIVKISERYPVGHYRVPRYIRGKTGVIESIIEKLAVNNEEEGFGRNAGSLGRYYRVAIPLSQLWAGYAGSNEDNLRIEIFHAWLEET